MALRCRISIRNNFNQYDMVAMVRCFLASCDFSRVIEVGVTVAEALDRRSIIILRIRRQTKYQVFNQFHIPCPVMHKRARELCP